jgi:hypothetical protein
MIPIGQAKEKVMVAMTFTPEDAEYIVRACNAYDDMLAALETVSTWASTPHGSRSGTLIRFATDVLPVVRAAIKKSKGEST